MEYIEEYLQFVKNQRQNVDDIINSCVDEIKDEIRQTIKARWLRGESVNGGKITNKATGGGYRSLSYEHLKLQKNPSAGGSPDLTLSGSLGDKITTELTDDGNHEIKSLDAKYEEIGNKYGFEEFGLTADEMIYFMKLLEERINNKLNNY